MWRQDPQNLRLTIKSRINPFIDLKIIMQRPSFEAQNRIWTLDMFKIDLIVVGKSQKGAWNDLIRLLQADEMAYSNYRSRKANILIPRHNKSMNNAWFYPNWMKIRLWLFWMNAVMACSLDFSQTLDKIRSTGVDKISFLIGESRRFTDDEVRNKANMLLSFGQQTWPHVMVRLMLMEQIYRAQQIIAGHPYHREG